MKDFIPSKEQQAVFEFDKKNLVINASAGSGKTTTLIELIVRLLEKGGVLKRMVLLTFTKAAANEMKEKLILRLMELSDREYIREQIDELLTSDISTIHSFLEKIIKKNINFLPDYEGFRVLDENENLLIKNECFERAAQQMQQSLANDYLFLALHLKPDAIKNILFSLDDFLSSVPNREEKLNYFKENFDQILSQSKAHLNDQILKERDGVLSKIENAFVEGKVQQYLQEIKSALTKVESNDVLKNLEILSQTKLPRQPVLTGQPCQAQVVAIKESANKLLKKAEKFGFSNLDLWSAEQTKKLTLSLYKLYELFYDQYCLIKSSFNALDFQDLEKRSEFLLSSPQILADVQQSYDFIFIDEYQDTNPVQEQLLKAISEKCKFIAVGDPKQGIYGFRNASSQIIINDTKKFIADQDSDAKFLKGNYRSDKQILEFVNQVFGKIMTEQTAGIDYLKTSMLSGKGLIASAGLPAVRINIAKKQKKEKSELSYGYDIFSDPLETDQNANLEAKIVAIRVEEFLLSKLTDPKSGKSRLVQPRDIAILTRGKSEISDAVALELRKRNLPFISTLRSDILQKAHAQLILSLLKLCVDVNDDISLAAFLLSPFGGVSMDELATISAGGNFCDMVFASQNTLIVSALEKLRDFKQLCQFKGAKIALEKIFAQIDFYVYLKTEIGESAVAEIESLLFAISSFENDKDIPALLSYLSSAVSEIVSNGENAITLSSIHASKGLEYPIVILIGTGKMLLRGQNEEFKIGSDYGLGLMHYDEQTWEKRPSPILLALRDKIKRQERIDELMILYVALTRAKSHLLVTGTLDKTNVEHFSEENFEKATSLLQLILSCSPEQAGATVEVVDEVESLKIEKTPVSYFKFDLAAHEKIKNYIEFSYPFESLVSLKQKSSVTELALGNHKFANNSEQKDLGILFHEALKILDFEKINKLEDIENQLKLNKFNENSLKMLDFSLIFENIKLIKPLIAGKTILKEKPFVMKIEQGGGAYLVQGIIDLFLKGEKNILIDYKFTSEKREGILLERYSKQLELYRQAIEEAEQIKIDEIYLISLKDKKIIKY